MDKTGAAVGSSDMDRTDRRPRAALLAPEVAQSTYFFLDLSTRASASLRVAFGGRERCSERYLVQRSTYPFLTLEYVAEGEGEIKFGSVSDSQRLGPGTLLVHGPKVPIRMSTAAGGAMLKYFVCLNGRAARTKVAAHGLAPGSLVSLSQHAEIRDMFDLLIREGAEHTPFTSSICERIFELLLLKISAARRDRSGERQSSSRERFLRCKQLLDEHSGRFSSLEDIADALRVDASVLNRLFQRYQGVSPYQYLLRTKMNRAAQDLIASRDLVKEVASRAGYADPYHFSRVFKAVHGISPAHFLKHHASE